MRKPFIHLLEDGEQLPFDVAGFRTIRLNHHDLDSVHEAKTQLRKQMEVIQTGEEPVDSPVSTAVDLEVMRQSEDEETKHMAQLISTVSSIHGKLSDPLSLLPADYLRQAFRQELVQVLSLLVTDSSWYTRKVFATGEVLTAADLNELARGGFSVETLRRVLERLSPSGGASRKGRKAATGRSRKEPSL